MTLETFSLINFLVFRKMDTIDPILSRLKSLDANENGFFIIDQLQAIITEYKKDENAGETL